VKKNQNGLINIFLLIIFLAVIGTVGYFAFNSRRIKPGVSNNTFNNSTGLKISPTPNQNSNTNQDLAFFKDDKFKISFYYPKNRRVSSQYNGGEGETPFWEVSIYNQDLFTANIIEENNPGNLTPAEWFNIHKKNYNDFIKTITAFDIDKNPILVTGIPNTCKSTPMFISFIKNGNKMLTIGYMNHSESDDTDDFSTILKYLHFSIEPNNQINNIPKIEFPSPPNNISCD
jgi:hypothetical protein